MNRFWHSFWVTLQKVGKPEIWIRANVITDGFPDRIVCLTREAFIHRTQQVVLAGNKFNDEEPAKRVKVADEPVVVINTLPMKSW